MSVQKTGDLRWFLMLIFMLGLIYNHGFAQTAHGTIEGRVLNRETNAPIVNANVSIIGTFMGAATDQHGRFIIEKVKPGTYFVLCSMIGFQKQELSINVLPAKRNTIIFELEESALQMRGVVVTASKYNQAIDDVPVTISVLKPEEITIRNAVTLDRALQYVPGVQTAGDNISIRGSTGFSSGLGTRTLVLLDGVPLLSGDEGSADFSTVPVLEIEQVEVMKGAGSALYGSSAMGGVINIITKKPEPDTSHLNLSFYSGLFSQPSYSQWRWSGKRKVFNGTSINYISNILGLASSVSINYHSNDSFKENNDFHYWNIYGKFRLKLNPNNDWFIQTGWLDSDNGGFIYWKDINHALQSGSDPTDRYSRTFSKAFYLNSIMTQTLSSRFYYRLRFNFHRNHAEDVEIARPNFAPEITGTIRETCAKTLGHEMQFGYQFSAQHNLTFGWEATLNHVSAIQYGNRQIGSGSLYAQYSVQPLFNLKIDLGGRWDAEQGSGITEVSQFNPKLGINYQLKENNIWRFSAGKGFRAPAIAERFISTFSNQIKVKPNPQLAPERNISLETGFRRQFNAIGYFDVGCFFNDFRDLIEPQLQPSELAVRFENITRARIYGLEVAQQLSFFKNQFTVNAAYTYLHTRDLSKMVNQAPNPDYNQELKYRPNHLVNLRGQYQWHSWIVGADFRYLSKIHQVDRLTDIPDLEKQVPAYVTDVQTGLKKANYSLMVIINNIFQYYYFISPGNLGDLRNFVLQLNWNYR